MLTTECSSSSIAMIIALISPSLGTASCVSHAYCLIRHGMKRLARQTEFPV